ncbi:hypothetical protein ACFQY4_13100 [Catellatospora bangladeshensis]|uniref:CopC domain-containing protein n=1 Tax=Catellatospora bangladeshensis TaxID=310355 RepID=A0A8J3NMU1_9ACTN|nr:hypothetical protein [Catellatospora bangladeshensis]GIF86305.1 hypothetical protein Cba03nite_76540 [Catellatospora bangladeshensis]
MKTIRRYAVAAVAAAALLLVPARPAAAHDGVLPTLHHDGRGTVWLTLAWSDGHPISEPAVALLSGRSTQGGSVAATALRPLLHDPATLPLPGTLAPGDWSLTIDVAAPGVGYCAVSLRVAADGVPQTLACAVPQTAAAAVTPPPPGRSAALPVTLGAVAVLALAALGWRLATRRAAPQRTGRPRRRIT